MILRAEHMLSIAKASLSPVSLEPDPPGLKRYIVRAPLGVVLVIAPWNFPYLTAINSVLPALLAGNSVLLKPSPQTPLAAERLAKALDAAGLPRGVMQAVHASLTMTEKLVKHRLVDFVSFTGSVPGGRAVERAAAEADGFKGVALEVRRQKIITLTGVTDYMRLAWWKRPGIRSCGC